MNSELRRRRSIASLENRALLAAGDYVQGEGLRNPFSGVIKKIRQTTAVVTCDVTHIDYTVSLSALRKVERPSRPLKATTVKGGVSVFQKPPARPQKCACGSMLVSSTFEKLPDVPGHSVADCFTDNEEGEHG